MPVSRKRKNGNSRQKKTVAVKPPQRTERWSANLNGSRLMYLRNDPDFLTIIKIGRAVNAICFAMNSLYYEDGKTVSSVRQYRRGCFILAGYLHEGLLVVKSIKGRYLTYPAFEPLRAMALGAEYKDEREYVRTIRNAMAFHLDEIDETTRHTLARIKPTMLPFMSGDDATFATSYFELSDYLDIAFLVEKFGNGREWDEAAGAVLESVMKFADKFLVACHDFHIALCNKIDISQHMYKHALVRR